MPLESVMLWVQFENPQGFLTCCEFLINGQVISALLREEVALNKESTVFLSLLKSVARVSAQEI